MSKLNVMAEPGKHEIILTRIFDAPRELVFKVYTDPATISKWWGTKTEPTTVDVMEVRPGGKWRYISHNPDGSEHGFHGVYHSITPNERIVHTFEFEGMPGHVLLETVTFEDYEGNKTLLRDSSVFQSVEDRDGMLASGMESGAGELYDRLEELLAKS